MLALQLYMYLCDQWYGTINDMADMLVLFLDGLDFQKSNQKEFQQQLDCSCAGAAKLVQLQTLQLWDS